MLGRSAVPGRWLVVELTGPAALAGWAGAEAHQSSPFGSFALSGVRNISVQALKPNDT